jgi:NAD(P)H-flavin reductase
MDDRFMVRAVSSEGPDIHRLIVHAPRVARYVRAGQFVIVRTTPDGERIPLTVCEADASEGTITLVVQGVGRTTFDILELVQGDQFADVLGPLGSPTHVEYYGSCVVVAGGVGVAIALPVAQAWRGAGNQVVGILGARSDAHLILHHDFTKACDRVLVTTEDGSAGERGLVTDALGPLLDEGLVDRVFVVGPIPMMRAVAAMTRPTGIATIASLNPLMVDGTGMCGGCRVAVGGETRFACIDGPEFDAHLVDFDALERRNTAYREFETCQAALGGSARHG